MIKPTAPCMGCSDKHIGCHGICDMYKAYTEANEEFKESIRQQKFVYNSLKDMHKEQYARYLRNRHKEN
ncbi:MAG: hypothetical protein UE851_01390 [Lachnospiraceae bacterium]|nr:hypothetical protein [Lachnospiraceae bacterium]